MTLRNLGEWRRRNGEENGKLPPDICCCIIPADKIAPANSRNRFGAVYVGQTSNYVEARGGGGREARSLARTIRILIASFVLLLLLLKLFLLCCRGCCCSAQSNLQMKNLFRVFFPFLQRRRHELNVNCFHEFWFCFSSCFAPRLASSFRAAI